ncbi:predicted restriction endonuclease [Hahella chejuensis KCTC 2396]|uniref:Predicted restriction endonuclease n=1 Tax=Hahella chejuensis (strain KCTC 2396) TaxID=349521 RepID=Q2SAM8_HAHCH|nr:HNH endonuclease signature motif containing protein [Hahella chejuensis]ABC32296.1 predicted restriction endonuclease [Hahella chejuensis KCTC 2396]
MAKLVKLSNTSWEQPFRDRKKEVHLWTSQSEVAEYCKLKDGTKRLLQITFEPRFGIDLIDYFQITSGREVRFPQELQDIIRPIVLNNPNSYFVVRVLNVEENEGSPPLNELNTDGSATIKTRVGQQRFRSALMEYWGGCALSGLQLPEILKASHIKPWRESDHTERLDPFNGILLSPTYDALFDRGYISFDDSGRIILSESAKRLSADLGLSKSMKLRKLDDRHRKYLRVHRSFFDPNR